MSVLLAACLIIAVHDGDTVTASCPTRRHALVLRVSGVDAPEMAAFSWAEQPGARAARDAASILCLQQLADVHLDKFDTRTGRWIARVECNGTDLSSFLVAQGLAWVYMAPKGSDLPALQRAAQDQRVGLWAPGPPAPMPPTQWRKGCRCVTP